MAAHTENSIRIEAPFSLVWEMTNDVANWTGLFTEYAVSEVLEREGDRTRFRLALHPDEAGRVWSWVSERVCDRAAKTVTARRIETGPFEFMNIHWSYRDLGTATEMTWAQDFAMKPGAPMDDAAMTIRINTNSATQMDIIRGRVETAGRSVPRAAARVVSLDDVPGNRRRGGELRTVLSPGNVHSTSGFMGVVMLKPDEQVGEHYHPYSEEFLFLVRGELTVDLDGVPTLFPSGHGLYIPMNVRHRLRNTGADDAFAVFSLGPLAPRPELGHVDTEDTS